MQKCSMLAKSMWNSEIASKMQIVILFFTFCSLMDPEVTHLSLQSKWKIAKLLNFENSKLQTAKLRHPTVFDSIFFYYCRIQFSTWSTWNQYYEDLHCFRRVILKKTLLSSPRYAPPSTQARRAAQCSSLASRQAELSQSAVAPSPTCRRPVPPSAQ